MDIDAMKGICTELEEKRKQLMDTLFALQELCRHPRESIVNDPDRTYCSLCEKKFWPAGTSYTHLVVIFPHDLDDIAATRVRITHEYTIVESALRCHQDWCLHPREYRIDWVEDNKCALCQKFGIVDQ